LVDESGCAKAADDLFYETNQRRFELRAKVCVGAPSKNFSISFFQFLRGFYAGQVPE
jgi:hypothetical protein